MLDLEKEVSAYIDKDSLDAAVNYINSAFKDNIVHHIDNEKDKIYYELKFDDTVITLVYNYYSNKVVMRTIKLNKVTECEHGIHKAIMYLLLEIYTAKKDINYVGLVHQNLINMLDNMALMSCKEFDDLTNEEQLNIPEDKCIKSIDLYKSDLYKTIIRYTRLNGYRFNRNPYKINTIFEKYHIPYRLKSIDNTQQTDRYKYIKTRWVVLRA